MAFSEAQILGRLKEQGGRCALCSLFLELSPRAFNDLVSEEIRKQGRRKRTWQAHHMDGNRYNDRYDNLALVHRHCHLEAHRGNFAGHFLLPRSAYHLFGPWTEQVMRDRRVKYPRRNPEPVFTRGIQAPYTGVTVYWP
jgi:hypothetical protein